MAEASPIEHALEKPKHVKTYTFGCKVNQADTAMMENLLVQTTKCDVNSGATPDVIVVNTCTVTAQADQQARQLIRKMHRNYPDAKIVVTGCYAESKPAQMKSIEGVNVVLPLAGQKNITELFGVTLNERQKVNFFPQKKKTRYTLKLQDGCNSYCSFCILPYVRGRSKSIPPQEILDSTKEAAKSFREIVLTGTHIGAYGRDLQPRLRLSDIVAQMIRGTSEVHFRVSSLEPMGLTKDFISLVSKEERIRPHFHIPLQSGSDSVLRRMNRKYSVKNYAERVTALYHTKKNTAIGADVIVGYPQETEAEFAQTYSLIQSLPITYLHVFPYSPRPGTKSDTMKDDVPPQVKKERVQILRDWAQKQKKNFYGRFLGKTGKVLVEQKIDPQGNLTAHTAEYIPARLHGTSRLMEQEVDVRFVELKVDSQGEYFLQAEMV